MIILAIESSCDETSISILKDSSILSNTVFSQIDIHTLYGGVVPEIASRSHTKVITSVLDKTLKDADIKLNDIDLIAVTTGPGLIGSLLVGVVCAQTLSLCINKPLLEINHIDGHIYSAAIEKELIFPAIILVISGGHTELIYAKDHYDFKIIGTTLDDAIGECYDKVARIIKLGYPGGPKIDNISKNGDMNKFKFKIPLLNSDNYDFSFSGLKSQVINLYRNLEQKNEKINEADLAASFQKTALDTILFKTRKALKDFNVENLVVCGGVSANKELRRRLDTEFSDINVNIPSFKYSTDNAAMIANAAKFKYNLLTKKSRKKLINNYSLKVFSTKDE